jgi:hypothetical protein
MAYLDKVVFRQYEFLLSIETTPHPSLSSSLTATIIIDIGFGTKCLY